MPIYKKISGIIQKGTFVAMFIRRLCFFINRWKRGGLSPIPNLNMSDMQHVFGNSATNSKDFEKSIIGKPVSYVYQDGDGE